jgi:hypothetical protein
MMEQFARLDGDVDRLMEIKARDLSDDWAYVQIAELLAEAGRDEAALAWTKRGLASAAEYRDRRLREFVADAYRRGGRAAEAVELRAEQFRDTPALDTCALRHVSHQHPRRRLSYTRASVDPAATTEPEGRDSRIQVAGRRDRD